MSHFINNQWRTGRGTPFTSENPATGQPLWQGQAATESEVNEAVRAARFAFEDWSDQPLALRIEYLEQFGEYVEARKSELAESIVQETGKPLWESLTEVGAMINKISISSEEWARAATTAPAPTTPPITAPIRWPR